jgi:protein-disulfide isomerase
MKPISLLLALASALSLADCTTPGLESRLSKMEAKQDSILKILSSMQEKADFVATRVGWRPPADTAPKVIPVGTSFSTGPEKAAVTIVEFSDLQCPYCSQFAPTLDSLSHAYPNDVRVIFKHFPLSFHPQARPASAAAIAAGKQGKFFEFRYKVAPHFRDLKDSVYLAVAKDLGLDLVRFKKDMALTPEVSKLLDEDTELGRRVGVEGTPTIFVNGRLAQERSYEYFEKLVKQNKGGG